MKEERAFTTTKAKSISKKAPSGILYVFSRGKATYPGTLEDLSWMERLCTKEHRCLLRLHTAGKKGKKVLKKEKLTDIVKDKKRGNLPPFQFSKSDKERKAEAEVSTAKEAIKTKKKLEKDIKRDKKIFFSEEWLDASITEIQYKINIFLESSKLSLDLKKKIVRELIEDDPRERKSLADKIEDVLSDYKE